MSPILIMMHGLTATGKSRLAVDLAGQLGDTEVIHSAKVRSDLHLTPDDMISHTGSRYKFSLNDSTFVKKVSPVVYREMLARADGYLVNNKNVILDASYSMRWERELVYTFIEDKKIFFIVLSCICNDEKIIESRLSERMYQAHNCLNEAPKWETYLSLKNHSDPIDEDKDTTGLPPKRIIVDTCTFDMKCKNIDGKQQEMPQFHKLTEAIKFIHSKKLLNKSVILAKTGKTVRLAIDFDGVVTNPHKMKAIELNRLGYSVTEYQSSRDYCTNVLKIPLDIYRRAANSINVDKLMDVPVEDEAQKVIKRLNEEEIEIFLVTSRMDDEIVPIRAYLEKYHISVDGILNSSEQSKIDCLRDIQPDIYIDDSLAKIISVISNISANCILSKCQCLLYENEANRSPHGKEKCIDNVSSWNDILFLALEIKKELMSLQQIS